MAAPFQNYDGGTFLSDLVTRPEFLSYIQEGIYEQCKFIQSGALVRNSALDARSGGVKVQVPFFRPIDPTEERIESNDSWGTSGAGYLTPQKITAAQQVMPILHRGFAYAVDDLSKLGTGADPMAAIRNQLAKAINKLRTRTLVAQLEGIFGTRWPVTRSTWWVPPPALLPKPTSSLLHPYCAVKPVWESVLMN